MALQSMVNEGVSLLIIILAHGIVSTSPLVFIYGHDTPRRRFNQPKLGRMASSVSDISKVQHPGAFLPLNTTSSSSPRRMIAHWTIQSDNVSWHIIRLGQSKTVKSRRSSHCTLSATKLPFSSVNHPGEDYNFLDNTPLDNTRDFRYDFRRRQKHDINYRQHPANPKRGWYTTMLCLGRTP